MEWRTSVLGIPLTSPELKDNWTQRKPLKAIWMKMYKNSCERWGEQETRGEKRSKREAKEEEGGKKGRTKEATYALEVSRNNREERWLKDQGSICVLRPRFPCNLKLLGSIQETTSQFFLSHDPRYLSFQQSEWNCGGFPCFSNSQLSSQ